jgi:hypothetical protein
MRATHSDGPRAMSLFVSARPTDGTRIGVAVTGTDVAAIGWLGLIAWMECG